MKDAEAAGVELLVADAVGDTDAVAEADAFAVAVAVPLALAVAEWEAPADGVNIAGRADPEVVHPATAAETRTTKVTAPAARVARTFIEPPAYGIETDSGAEIAGQSAMACFPFDY
ncbi:MAG: hypothetical protein ACRDN0_35515 [Trebonia sp.]